MMHGPANLHQSYVNRFGNKETVLLHDTESFQFHKHIDVQKNPHYYFDYKQQTRHLNDLTAYLKKDKVFGQQAEFPTCHTNRTTNTDPDSAYMFLPAYTGNLKFD